MKSTHSNLGDEIIKNKQVSLLELLDKLLDKGVVIKGEILLSVADIDLVYLNVGLLLSSVKTVFKTFDQNKTVKDDKNASYMLWQNLITKDTYDAKELSTEKNEYIPQNDFSSEYSLNNQNNEFLHIETILKTSLLTDKKNEVVFVEEISETPPLDVSKYEAMPLEEVSQIVQVASKENREDEILDQAAHTGIETKAHINPENVEKGLTKLVLTVIDLLRKLMEKQAIQRIEARQVDESGIEKVADTFFLLDQKMEQLKETFGLQNEELNLDLGPLGELI